MLGDVILKAIAVMVVLVMNKSAYHANFSVVPLASVPLKKDVGVMAASVRLIQTINVRIS